MNIDSLFHVPLRDSIIYTMLLCNEGFKKTKLAGEIVNSIPLRRYWVFQGTNELNWIAGMQGSYRVAVSFLILTHVNTNDVDHWFISVSGTIGCELSKSWWYVGHFYLLLVIEKPILFHICNSQKCMLLQMERYIDYRSWDPPVSPRAYVDSLRKREQKQRPPPKGTEQSSTNKYRNTLIGQE